ncbi:SCO6745 family protein [Actinomycetospora atypica]|uniref:SalK n=1 Tax=Actinomycetospora atypica TaxID=1290095 RepID=A0ABV9YP31_9PSEU
MEPADVARTYRRLESLHSMIYFAPEVSEELSELGITHPRAQYFAQRSAAMGAVGPGVVAATYYNFNPALVARFVPGVWASAAPAAVLNGRLRAADRALRRLLGDAATSRECDRAGYLARRATEACTPEDRPLYAAHADLPWPEDQPHLVLFHAVTLLREYRGDAHLHALLAAGVSGLEALILHTATGRGFLPEVAQATRGWSPEQWGEASSGLRERGLIDGEGALTADGAAFRDGIEAETTRLSAAPFERVGDDVAELSELGAGLTKIALGNGAFPAGVFSPAADRSPKA